MGDNQTPLTVVCIDSHVGPDLKDHLRQYCPKEHLDEFDSFAAGFRSLIPEMPTGEGLPPEMLRTGRHMAANNTPGHYDLETRHQHMDADGIAAEIVFHGSQNMNPLPFMPGAGADAYYLATGPDRELVAVGYHMYNQWLADFIAPAPERHVGAIHIPLWDIEGAIRELEWGKEHGLNAVNLPSPKPGIAEYDDPVYEPFWSACDDLELPLSSHSGVGDFSRFFGPQIGATIAVEAGGWQNRRGMGRMLLGGVFERHPNLKLVTTEQGGTWWTYTKNEYDSAYLSMAWMMRHAVPKLPSEYMAGNVFVGHSFMASFEAETAVDEGYARNVMWGRDYPHVEGTWRPYTDTNGDNMTHLSMRFALSKVPADDIRWMLGENAIEVFHLDREKLGAIAGRINAPTIDELQTPIDMIPEEGGTMSFRLVGPHA